MHPPKEADWKEFVSDQNQAVLNECQNALADLLNTGSSHASLIALRETFLSTRKLIQTVVEADGFGVADILKDVEGAEALGLYSDIKEEREALIHAFKLMIERLLPAIKSESEFNEKAERFERALLELKGLLDIEI